MEKLKNYIKKILGIDLKIKKISRNEVASMPLYLRNRFDIYRTYLLNKEVVLVYAKDLNTETKQIEKQRQNLRSFFNSPVIIVFEEISAVARQRLINKKINFIVPGKQMFLPELLMDLRETYKVPYKTDKKLLPSAQVILIYNILNRNEAVENYSFKELAQKFNYTQMAITKAANNLSNHKICDIKGTKEKYLYFNIDKRELWNEALNLLANPVNKQVYVDELPQNTELYKSNEAALPVYTEIAEGNQLYYAIFKDRFYQLQREERLKNLNEEEGNYCMEIWKYNPGILTQHDYVDPLSLYISLKENTDERIQMALEQILKTYIW